MYTAYLCLGKVQEDRTDVFDTLALRVITGICSSIDSLSKLDRTSRPNIFIRWNMTTKIVTADIVWQI